MNLESFKQADPKRYTRKDLAVISFIWFLTGVDYI